MAKLRARAVGSVLSVALCSLCVFCTRSVGGGLAHVAPPNPDGTSCNDNVECASDDCTAGVCQPPANGEIEIDGICSGGGKCVADATCEGDICVANASACAALLAPCLVGDDCCSGACSTAGNCTGSKTSCADESDPCLADSDCCMGLCDFRNATSSGQGQCSTTCTGFTFGEGCSIGGCCKGYCATPYEETYPQCQYCSEPTSADGQQCLTDADCCSETCVGATGTTTGYCQCLKSGVNGPCHTDSDCCGLTCVNATAQVSGTCECMNAAGCGN